MKDHCLYSGWCFDAGDYVHLLVPVGGDVEKLFASNFKGYAPRTATYCADVPASALKQWQKAQEKPSDANELEAIKAIYQAYPRHVAPEAAYRAIKKALGKFPFYTILFATTSYAEAVKSWPPNEKKFVPMPASWFNRGSYNDNPGDWKRGEVVPDYEKGF